MKSSDKVSFLHLFRSNKSKFFLSCTLQVQSSFSLPRQTLAFPEKLLSTRCWPSAHERSCLASVLREVRHNALKDFACQRNSAAKLYEPLTKNFLYLYISAEREIELNLLVNRIIRGISREIIKSSEGLRGWGFLQGRSEN